MAPQDINNPILKLSGEHEFVANYVERVDRHIQAQDYHEALSEFQAKAQRLMPDLREHFDIEDKVILPAAVLGDPRAETVDMVIALAREHGALDFQFDLLDKRLAKLDASDPAAVRAFIAALRAVLFAFKKHAMVEIGLLFPLVDRSDECSAHVRKLMRKRQAKT